MKINGTCASCPDYERPQIDGKSCKFEFCKNQKVNITGGCEDCAKYTRIQEDGKTCK